LGADGSQVDFLISEAKSSSFRRSERLWRHAEDALIPRCRGIDIAAIQHDMVEPFRGESLFQPPANSRSQLSMATPGLYPR
jgi:hypothetical protein